MMQPLSAFQHDICDPLATALAQTVVSDSFRDLSRYPKQGGSVHADAVEEIQGLEPVLQHTLIWFSFTSYG
jgi:hypothetical protein